MSDRIVECRLCGFGPLTLLYSFGPQPVAGYLVKSAELARSQPKRTLALGLCSRCGHCQQAHDNARDLLSERVYAQYQATYSASTGVSQYLRGFLDRALAAARAAPGDLVIEIGSNDGHVLEELRNRGLRPLGVEPAKPLCELSRERGLDVVNDFLSAPLARRIRADVGQARVVVTRHTLEHAYEPLDFLLAIRELLAPDGLAAIEVPSLLLQLMNGHFEAMTFQHVSFFSAQSMLEALRLASLEAVDIAHAGMDGGSIVVYARPLADAATLSPRIQSFCAIEKAAGIGTPLGSAAFFERLERMRATASGVFGAFRSAGLVVAGYGAGSKGQSLVNILGLDPSTLPFIMDDVPENARSFVPAAAIEVVGSLDPRRDSVDIAFITAPTHWREIRRKDSERRRSPIRYLVTVPDLHLVPDTDG